MMMIGEARKESNVFSVAILLRLRVPAQASY
jgi:hypothetical protein